MIKEIKEKINEKKKEIKEKSESLRRDGKINHTCPNCNKQVSGNRLYCSDKCRFEFITKYDYSASSQILKEYKNNLLEEYEKNHPKKEIKPWSEPIARKSYKCWFCGLEISKGEKYVKYTCIPGEEFFDECPYETTNYHEKCMEFINECVEIGIFSDEGFDKDEVLGVSYALAIESNHTFEETNKMIKDGKFTDKGIILNMINPSDYESDFSITPIYDDEEPDSENTYIYLVELKIQNIKHKELLQLQHEIQDPYKYFSKYYEEERVGDMFNGIISIKSLKVPVVQMKVE